MDYISVTHFSELTRKGLMRWAEAHDYCLEGGSLESWAWVYFRLHEAEDKPEFFPRGKSATIQQLELFLAKAAHDAEQEPPCPA